MAAPQPPPLTLVRNHPYGPYNCAFCGEEYACRLTVGNMGSHDTRPWQTEDGDLVCKECIKGRFEDALRFELLDFSAHWGDIELNMSDFASLWPDKTLPELYKAKHAELKLLSQRDESTLNELVPEGLVPGQDYQRCPKCKSCVGLLEGCNHMTCTCGFSFCFICGVDAQGDSAHWRDGSSCPRYNGTGNGGRPVFDPVVDGDADIGAGDEEFDIDGRSDWIPDLVIETWG
jgi:hypothetical protein